ncbi:MAG: FHA domain-containing protein [Myxococcota bacterium]|nr:FHA domain-containing protein [Myxococcota bacterium]
MAIFRVYLGRKLIGEYEFMTGPVMVGRHPASDIFISQDVISRRHAIFRRTGRTWSVANTGSQNGIYINGTFTNEGPLANGDRVELGGCVIQLFYDKSEASRVDGVANAQATMPQVGDAESAVFGVSSGNVLIASPTRPMKMDDLPTDVGGHDEESASTVTLTVQQVSQLHAMNEQTHGPHVWWINNGAHARRSIRKGRPLLIGRGRSADIVVTGAVGIGSNIARLFLTDQYAFVERCSRLVAVKVNDLTIRGVRRLNDGDRIAVGDLELTYQSGLFEEGEG